MANVLGRLYVSTQSSSWRLLPCRNDLHQSFPGPRPKQQRLAIGAPKETSIKSQGLQRRTWSSERTGSRFKNQESTFQHPSGLQEGVSTLDHDTRIQDQNTASPSWIDYESGSSGSATQLVVDRIELVKETATDSGTVLPSPLEVQWGPVQKMHMRSGSAAEYHHPYSHLKVAPKWREYQGEKNWAGMLDPLDPALRGEIIRYGEFAQAAYDAFDYESNSPYCGTCKYNKKRLLQKVGLENRGYEITDYLYATAGHSHPVASLLRKLDFDPTDDVDSDEVWDPETNWVGFVAVCTDPKEIARLGRRDIVIVWRGTVAKLEWLENLRDYLLPTGFVPRSPGQGVVGLKVEAGFLTLYKTKNEASKHCKTKSAREQVLEAVRRLVHQYRFDELSITLAGHSLGSALAMICAYDLAESRINQRLKPHRVDAVSVPHWEDPEGLASHVGKLTDPKMDAKLGPIPITVYSFAGPRVGNDAFRDRLMEDLGVKVLRVVNKNDKVPKVPGIVFNERLQFLEDKLKPVWKWLDSLPWTYSHVGVKLELDNTHSPFLRDSNDALDTHNLEAYLHLVDGYQGPTGRFESVIARDIALVNKASNFLKPKCFIPAHWYQEENKGLKLTEEGKWVPPLRDPEDLPEHDIRN